MTPTPGAWRSLRPRVRVPARVRHLLPVAAAVFLATWATGAFYQAFVPALVEDQLHTRSPLVLGLVFAAYMGPSVLGAPLGGRFTPATAQRVGMIAFLAGMIGIITAIATGTLALFIVATIVAGAGSRHRHQRRHPRPAARQHPGRPGTDLQRDLPPQLQRRDHSQPHLRPTFQHLLATADRPRIRRTCPRRHPVHCHRCTQPAHRHDREQPSTVSHPDEPHRHPMLLICPPARAFETRVGTRA